MLSTNSLYMLATAELSFEPIFGWWFVVVMTIIMLASVWLTITMTSLTRKSRLALVTIRIAAILILLLGWLRPAILTDSDRETEGAIAVLMDRSLSSTLPSDTVGKSRWEVQQEVWNAIVSSTNMKIGGADIVPYFYDKDLAAASQTDLPSLKQTFATQPSGRLTDLGNTLAELNKAQVIPPLRAVVMMGDAVQTRTPPLSDPLLIARQMSQLDQPIYFVPVAGKGESGMLRDVALEGLPEELTAFVNKRKIIPLVINSQGMQGQKVQVTLTLKSRNKPDQVIHQKTINPASANEKFSTEFTSEFNEVGDYLLVAEAKVDSKEQITSNNQIVSFVTVSDGGVRMLYVEGEPRFEQQFLRLSLDTSKDFDVNYVWVPYKQGKGWPKDLTRDPDSVRFQDYDVFVIGDIDRMALTDGNWSAIANRISQGAGVLFMGGYFSYEAGGHQNGPLRDLFPIKMQPNVRQNRTKRVDERFHYLEDIQLMPTRPHPITNLRPEPENTQLWRSLKPMLKGMNRFQDLSNSPGVQVLLAGPQNQPALVTGQFGNGRVLAFAGDTTYQWYRSGDESGHRKAHQTFWRQAVLWLVNRERLSDGFQMFIDSRRQDIDATPNIRIEWFGGSESTSVPQSIKVALSRDGEFVKNLEVTSVNDSIRQAAVSGLDRPGLYRAFLTATDAAGKQHTSETAFLVQDVSKELSQPAADWRMIANIVAAGKEAGSEIYLPEDTGKLVEKLRERQNSAKVSTIERRRLGDQAWDTWLFFVLFCALMTLEWSCRKRWQLP